MNGRSGRFISAICRLLLLAGLQMLPQECYESARVDGIHPVKVFFKVTLPLIKPALMVAVIFRILDAMRIFDLIYVMTQGGPGTATMTLSIYGWKVAFTSFDIGRGAAIAVMMLVATVLATTVLVRRIRR